MPNGRQDDWDEDICLPHSTPRKGSTSSHSKDMYLVATFNTGTGVKWVLHTSRHGCGQAHSAASCRALSLQLLSQGLIFVSEMVSCEQTLIIRNVLQIAMCWTAFRTPAHLSGYPILVTLGGKRLHFTDDIKGFGHVRARNRTQSQPLI